MRSAVTIIALMLIAVPSPAVAEIYRFTDSKGEIHFVDDISKVPKKYRKQLGVDRKSGDISIIDATPVPVSRRTEEPRPARKEMYGNTNVEVFLSPQCGYCKKMLRFLNERGIPYTAYDINTDVNAARTYRELGGTGVPLVRIGSNLVHGYNPEAVLSHLNRR